jgi:hypothetical protein
MGAAVGELTCAERADDDANVEPSYDAVGAKQGTIYKAQESHDGGIVVHKFEEVVAIGTLKSIP